MICQQCNVQLMEDTRFCPQCGTPVPQPPVVLVCQQCQTELPEGARFCTKCGTPVSEPQVPPVSFEGGANRSTFHQNGTQAEEHFQHPVGDPQVYLQLGNVAYGNGEHHEAIERYTDAIHIYPDYVYAYHSRGLAYGALGEYQRAIENFDKAIQLAPNNPWGYNNRGRAYHELGQASNAQQDWDKARSLGIE